MTHRWLGFGKGDLTFRHRVDDYASLQIIIFVLSFASHIFLYFLNLVPHVLPSLSPAKTNDANRPTPNCSLPQQMAPFFFLGLVWSNAYALSHQLFQESIVFIIAICEVQHKLLCPALALICSAATPPWPITAHNKKKDMFQNLIFQMTQVGHFFSKAPSWAL